MLTPIPDRSALTDRQAECLAIIRKHWIDHSYSPTARFICQQMGSRNHSEGALCNVRALVRKVEHIAARTAAFQSAGDPVVSVDTKKKELVGNFKNVGSEWRPHGELEKVKVHDFVDKQLGRAIPYGVCDLAANAGWVSVGSRPPATMNRSWSSPFPSP